jgi:hypothetical protein
MKLLTILSTLGFPLLSSIRYLTFLPSLSSFLSVLSIVAAVRRVRFYQRACKSGDKFHVSVGNTTVIGE